MTIVSVEFKDGTQKDFEVDDWTLSEDFISLYRSGKNVGYIRTTDVRYILEKP